MKGHLLSDKQNDLPILFVGFAQQAAKLAQKLRIFAWATPSDLVGRLALWKIQQFGRLLTIVEKLINRNF